VKDSALLYGRRLACKAPDWVRFADRFVTAGSPDGAQRKSRDCQSPAPTAYPRITLRLDQSGPAHRVRPLAGPMAGIRPDPVGSPSGLYPGAAFRPSPRRRHPALRGIFTKEALDGGPWQSGGLRLPDGGSPAWASKA